MAKEKTQTDVELARIKAELERSKLICGVIRWGLTGFFATLMLSIVAWATVRMTDKPAWLTFALALLAAAGGPSIVAWRLAIRIARDSTAISRVTGDRNDSGGEA
jgi:hypothetical protein